MMCPNCGRALSSYHCFRCGAYLSPPWTDGAATVAPPAEPDPLELARMASEGNPNCPEESDDGGMCSQPATPDAKEEA